MIEQNKKDLKFRVLNKDGVLMFLTPQVDMARQMERHLNYLEEKKNRVTEAPVVSLNLLKPLLLRLLSLNKKLLLRYVNLLKKKS